jgi:histidinol-phosphate/aromatic aminotransferase/cobyric acid decarboxylase-like protein
VHSVTNFVLVFFGNNEATWEALTEAGVVARRIHHSRIAEAIRFTIGTTEQMAMVIQILKRLS